MTLRLLAQALPQLKQAFGSLPALTEPRGEAAMAAVLAQVTARMADNYPYFHPLYAGQMLKPPHPIAHAAYALAMWLNPNNHARDGGRASSTMEIEAVRAIASMFGWPSTGPSAFLGHLTSGGTFANLEALWVAGQLAPGKRAVASEQAHYTHNRINSVLRVPFSSIPADDFGRMDLAALESDLREGDVATVVATLGTTGVGAVDPLPQILQLREKYGFRVHVDAAYGGYFKLIADELGGNTRLAFEAIAEADSIVVDPHKHGLQPYGCGCVLFRDASVGRFYKHDSPYTYFTSADLHLGEISLECSRAGAAAVALWATQQLLPLTPKGEFAANLGRSREAAENLYRRLRQDSRFIPAFEPELDIVIWGIKAPSVQESSRRANVIFSRAAELDLHLALVQVPASFFAAHTWPDADPATRVTCLRSVLMKPEHLEWMDVIWQKLDQATQETE